MEIRTPKQMLTDQLVVKHYAGSIAYGTNLPTSDVDIRGIFCADEIYQQSPWLSCGELTISSEEDTKYYELVKFLCLMVNQNPNIIETLWVDSVDVIQSSPAYEFLRQNRELLLSSKCAFTFSGYAHSQLNRIKGHNKWINNPQPVQPPKHGNYLKLIQNFTSKKIFNSDFTNNYNNFLKNNQIVHYGDDVYGVVANGGVTSIDGNGDFNVSAKNHTELHTNEPPMFIIRYMHQQYKIDKQRHTQYWDWKNNRNVKRSALEEQFGYDTKHAMHLIRLLRMSKEILTEHKVKVKRDDASELLEIREGKYDYETIIKMAENLQQETEGLYNTTKLRKRVNTTTAAKILLETQQLVW